MTKKILLAAAMAFLACEKLPEECGDHFIDSDTQFCTNSQIFEKCWGEEFNPLTEFCYENVVYGKCNGQTYIPPNSPCGERSSSSLNIIGYSSSSAAGNSSSSAASSSSSLNIGSSSSSIIGGSSSSIIGGSSSSIIGSSSSSATLSSSSVATSSSSVALSSSSGVSFTVTFDGNGATGGTAPEAVKANYGATIYLPGRGTLERTGYTFGGWNAVSPYTVTDDVIIYAKWIPIFTVTFDGNEATSGVKPTAMKADSGSAIQLPSGGNLQRTGYAFAGWTANIYGTDIYDIGSSYTVKMNITLYAVWAVACTGSDNTETHYCSGGGLPLKEYGSFTDDRSYPHQTYKTVKIGTQTWMAENLNYPAEDSRCNNCEKYGRLYYRATAMDGAANSAAVPSGVQGVCPDDWHLPSKAEWDVMTAYIGEGKKLRTTSGWNIVQNQSSSGNGTDEYGFSALPGGASGPNGSFAVGSMGFWWTADIWNSPYNYNYNYIGMGYINTGDGGGAASYLYSVRCVKD